MRGTSESSNLGDDVAHHRGVEATSMRTGPARLTAATSSAVLALGLGVAVVATPAAAQDAGVEIITPDGGNPVDGVVTLAADVEATDADAVEFFHRGHDAGDAVSLGAASHDSSSGLWVLDWDTRTVPDTHRTVDGTDVSLTQPATYDEIGVVASTAAGELSDTADVRVQNMLTVRTAVPSGSVELRGFEDLEALVTSEHEVDAVRFDVYAVDAGDPRLLAGDVALEDPRYGSPLGDPVFPTGEPLHAVGEAAAEGTARWALHGWDTTTVPDGRYLLVATATDAADRRATYTVETFVVNDVSAAAEPGDLVTVTAPFEGQVVAGVVPVTAATTSTVTASEVEVFLDGASIGLDGDGSDGWSVSWDTSGYPDGAYTLSVVARFADGTEAASGARAVSVENAAPAEPAAPAGTFQTGRVTDTVGPYLTYRHELADGEEPGGPPQGDLLIPDAAMQATFSDLEMIPGDGIIGGDVLEFDVTVTNTSPTGSGIVLSAFAFQSKFSESPAIASRIGDKLFYGQVTQADPPHPDGPMGTVKKNGTSQGLFSGKWKGICLNSSTDFIPEFNSGLEDESLECAGNRSDSDVDGEPEILTGDAMLGLRPGESQVVRLSLDSGTTDGALHVVEPGTLQGRVLGTPVQGPNGLEYYVPTIDPAVPGNVLSIPDFGDNKGLRAADGSFDPTFAPAADDFTFANQTYLTLPRANYAFSDILGRNHSCGTYGLAQGACSGGGRPLLGFLDTGDLVPGVQNFAAILRGFGEFHDPDNDLQPDVNPAGETPTDTRPSEPYGVLCENCGGVPYVPVAEFFVDGGAGAVTQSIVAGGYGDPVTDPYLATIDATTSDAVKEQVIPEPDPGGPCDPVTDPDSRRPSCAQLRTSAVGHFHDLAVVPGAGINGGDAVEFTVDVTNTSTNADAYLTAFNYQTKRRGLADIGILDGYSQDRRDVRVDSSLPPCTSLADEACWNAELGVGHFPNVIGNGLLFGQMVWTDADAGREAGPIESDLVHVDAATGIDPVPYRLESVKKNGPFSPILKGNTNFICLKSGLFDNDPDADAGCAGEPAILVDEDGEVVPANITQRLGLPAGETQQVRIRMEWGDFRGAMLEIVAGTLTAENVAAEHAATGGLAREYDCSDQRELEFCHPELVGVPIGYVPGSDATWLTPQTVEEIEHVIINQPGDAPVVMNFQENLGQIMAMAGFLPSAEFWAPDPNPDLVGTPYEGVLIRQQVLGAYDTPDLPPVAPVIGSAPVTEATAGTAYTYDVQATGRPAAMAYSLDTAPAGMVVDAATGVVSWTPDAAGTYDVAVRVANGTAPDAVQAFQVTVAPAPTPPVIGSAPVTEVAVGAPYTYQVQASGVPAALTYTLDIAPPGMVVDGATGLITWTPAAAGTFDVAVRASNGTPPDAVQAFQVTVPTGEAPLLDDFNRANGAPGTAWGGLTAGYRVNQQRLNVNLGGGPLYWRTPFGADQHAAVTFAKVDRIGQQSLLLKADRDHLRLSAIVVSYQPLLRKVTVTSVQHGKLPRTVGDFRTTLSAGDRLGARALSDGTVSVSINDTLIGTANAGSFFAGRGGHVGVMNVLVGGAVLDDFAGGTVG